LFDASLMTGAIAFTDRRAVPGRKDNRSCTRGDEPWRRLLIVPGTLH
jgi:hypothetical protein